MSAAPVPPVVVTPQVREVGCLERQVQQTESTKQGSKKSNGYFSVTTVYLQDRACLLICILVDLFIYLLFSERLHKKGRKHTINDPHDDDFLFLLRNN